MAKASGLGIAGDGPGTRATMAAGRSSSRVELGGACRAGGVVQRAVVAGRSWRGGRRQRPLGAVSRLTDSSTEPLGAFSAVSGGPDIAIIADI